MEAESSPPLMSAPSGTSLMRCSSTARSKCARSPSTASPALSVAPSPLALRRGQIPVALDPHLAAFDHQRVRGGQLTDAVEGGMRT